MIVKGDINNDGRINIEDGAILRLHLLGKINLADNEFVAADINNDGQLDIVDLAAINLHCLGVKMIEGDIQQ